MKHITSSRYFYAITGPIVFVIVWGILSGLNNASTDPLVPKLFVSTPQEVGTTLWNLLINDDLIKEAWETLKRLLGGFALSVAIGVPLGLAMGY